MPNGVRHLRFLATMTGAETSRIEDVAHERQRVVEAHNHCGENEQANHRCSGQAQPRQHEEWKRKRPEDERRTGRGPCDLHGDFGVAEVQESIGNEGSAIAIHAGHADRLREERFCSPKHDEGGDDRR